MLSGKLLVELPLMTKTKTTQSKTNIPLHFYTHFNSPRVSSRNWRIAHYLKQIEILYEYQYGFRGSSDTSSATVDMVCDIQSQMEKGMKCALVSLDLRKAFVTDNHKILLGKLDKLGIRGICFDLFKSYLSDRRQRVLVNGVLSSEKCINTGVPQGSILGPTLFLIYINSLSKLQLKGGLRLYADDALLLYFNKSNDNIQQGILQDLDMVSKWLRSHILTLNIDKSSFMFIANKNKNQHVLKNLVFNNQTLKNVNVIKYLGLYIDQCMTWENHINHIQNKIAPPIGILKRLSYTVPAYLLRSVYFSLIHSHLQYLVLAWYPTCEKYVKNLRILQNKAIKNIYSLPHRFRTKSLYTNYNIVNLDNMYNLQVCLYIHGILSKSRHSNLSLNIRNQFHEYYTRQQDHIELPTAQSRFMRNSILYRGAKIYNNLPPSFKPLHMKQFKKKIKSHFPPSLSLVSIKLYKFSHITKKLSFS